MDNNSLKYNQYLLKEASSNGPDFWKGFFTYVLTKSAAEQDKVAEALKDVIHFPEHLEKKAFFGLLAKGLGVAAKPLSGIVAKTGERQAAKAAAKAAKAAKINANNPGMINRWRARKLSGAAESLGTRAAGTKAMAQKLSNFSNTAANSGKEAGKQLKSGLSNWFQQPLKNVKSAWKPADGSNRRWLPSFKSDANPSVIGSVAGAAFSPQAMIAAGGIAAGSNLAQAATGMGKPTEEINNHNALKSSIVQQLQAQQAASQMTNPYETPVQQTLPM